MTAEHDEGVKSKLMNETGLKSVASHVLLSARKTVSCSYKSGLPSSSALARWGVLGLLAIIHCQSNITPVGCARPMGYFGQHVTC